MRETWEGFKEVISELSIKGQVGIHQVWGSSRDCGKTFPAEEAACAMAWSWKHSMSGK